MRTRYLLLLIALLTGVIGSTVRAQAPPADLAKTQATVERKPRPTGAVAADTCTTSGCHADVKDYRVLHGPVNVNSCDACHKLTDEKQHTYALTRTKAETCTFCHQLETRKDPVVHKPLADGACLECHNPHGGTTSKFLRGKTMAEMCARCHQDTVGNKSHVHGPVAAGACGSCHKAHSSQFPKLLVAQGRDLCLDCHTDMRTQMTQVKFRHKAVEQDCTSCHDAHASNFPMQVKQAPAQLCTSCHEHDAIKKAAMDSKHKHSVVTNDQACLNCHTAHGGDLAKLMKNDELKVCMKCHDKPIDRGKDVKPIASVAEVLDPNMVKHGPIQKGNCGGCHEPHGSDNARLLDKAYPEGFYTGFKTQDYDLCFSCHNKELVTLEKTSSLTNFRNGERNLHFVHVNKNDRGRSCRACHEVHASAQPLHVRESVPYGNWKMPLNFRRTETGGSCASGCHKPYGYDRVTPVQNSTEQNPTPMPAPTPAAKSSSTVSADGKDGRP
jgi:predicted CXXCH cytochrome family protein